AAKPVLRREEDREIDLGVTVEELDRVSPVAVERGRVGDEADSSAANEVERVAQEDLRSGEHAGRRRLGGGSHRHGHARGGRRGEGDHRGGRGFAAGKDWQRGKKRCRYEEQQGYT